MNNPTPALDPRREQAARLREMAGYEQAKATEWERHSVAPVPPCGYSNRGCAQASQSCAAAAAALLAGAAALEAVEVAKGALRHACPELVIIQDEQGGCVWCGAFGRTQSRYPQDKDHVPDCAWLEARSALARLEAL